MHSRQPNEVKLVAYAGTGKSHHLMEIAGAIQTRFPGRVACSGVSTNREGDGIHLIITVIMEAR